MNIEYKNKKIEAVCTQYDCAVRRYNEAMAEKIHLRIDQIKASLSVEDMIRFRVGKCHQLSGQRKLQYAMSLVEPYRLIFEKIGKDSISVNIVEIVDYH